MSSLAQSRRQRFASLVILSPPQVLFSTSSFLRRAAAASPTRSRPVWLMLTVARPLLLVLLRQATPQGQPRAQSSLKSTSCFSSSTHAPPEVPSVPSSGIMSAAFNSYPSIVLLLLQHSANPDLHSASGVTALMLAADKGHKACMQALLRATGPSFSTKRATPPCLARAVGRIAAALPPPPRAARAAPVRSRLCPACSCMQP